MAAKVASASAVRVVAVFVAVVRAEIAHRKGVRARHLLSLAALSIPTTREILPRRLVRLVRHGRREIALRVAVKVVIGVRVLKRVRLRLKAVRRGRAKGVVMVGAGVPTRCPAKVSPVFRVKLVRRVSVRGAAMLVARVMLRIPGSARIPGRGRDRARGPETATGPIRQAIGSSDRHVGRDRKARWRLMTISATARRARAVIRKGVPREAGQVFRAMEIGAADLAVPIIATCPKVRRVRRTAWVMKPSMPLMKMVN